MYIVVNGNPAEGFVFTGPFEDAKKAYEYIEVTGIEDDYWVQKLDAPEWETKEDKEHDEYHRRLFNEGR